MPRGGDQKLLMEDVELMEWARRNGSDSLASYVKIDDLVHSFFIDYERMQKELQDSEAEVERLSVALQTLKRVLVTERKARLAEKKRNTVKAIASINERLIEEDRSIVKEHGVALTTPSHSRLSL